MAPNNKPMTWEQIPEAIKQVAKNWADSPTEETFDECALMLANDIIEAMNPELEKAKEKGWNEGYKDGRQWEDPSWGNPDY